VPTFSQEKPVLITGKTCSHYMDPVLFTGNLFSKQGFPCMPPVLPKDLYIPYDSPSSVHFKLIYGQLNGIFLTGNFAWAFSRPFVNSGQKHRAKFLNFDPCTVCGKTLQVSRAVYLPAFWAKPPYYSRTCFLGHTLLQLQRTNYCTADCNLEKNNPNYYVL
jgi:hypothetical protein